MRTRTESIWARHLTNARCLLQDPPPAASPPWRWTWREASTASSSMPMRCRSTASSAFSPRGRWRRNWRRRRTASMATSPAANSYTVARLAAGCSRGIADSWREGRLPIVTGGTGLYFRALETGPVDHPADPAGGPRPLAQLRLAIFTPNSRRAIPKWRGACARRTGSASSARSKWSTTTGRSLLDWQQDVQAAAAAGRRRGRARLHGGAARRALCPRRAALRPDDQCRRAGRGRAVITSIRRCR